MLQSTIEVERLTQLGMRAGIVVERNSGRGRFPSLSQRRDAGCRSAWMREDAAAGQVHQIKRLGLPLSLRRLSAPLAGGNHRHYGVAAQHWRETSSNGADHRFVRFAELVFEAVHVELINTGEPPEFLV